MKKPRGLTKAEIRRYSRERLASMKQAGIRFCQVLGPGTEVGECETCLALQRRGRFPIEEAKLLPPEGCTCQLGCRCVIIASQ